MPADVINLPVLSDGLEDSFAGATQRLLSVHFGVPNIGPGRPGELFRWDQPLNMRDSFHGAIGTRSGMWHPARKLVSNSEGRDGSDFARQGDQTNDMEDGW